MHSPVLVTIGFPGHLRTKRTETKQSRNVLQRSMSCNTATECRGIVTPRQPDPLMFIAEGSRPLKFFWDVAKKIYVKAAMASFLMPVV